MWCKRTSVSPSKGRWRPSGYTLEVAVWDEAIATACTTAYLFGMHAVGGDEDK